MRERIVAGIGRLAEQKGVAPGVRAFELETGILRREWIGKIWARWGDALAEAGYEPNALTSRRDSEEVLKFVAECCLAIGRWPGTQDFRLYARNNPGFPASNTIDNHFPKRSILADALRAWVRRPENVYFAGLETILPEAKPAEVETSRTEKYGHVYLLRAGDYYKIGQSSDIEKRVKSINVALPDKATLEHAISTDDPPGIEAYWHRRFADRCMNGEWFKLSKADILAFKKRKFQ